MSRGLVGLLRSAQCTRFCSTCTRQCTVIQHLTLCTHVLQTGTYARCHRGLAPNGSMIVHKKQYYSVREAILSSENSGKPVGDWRSTPNPAGKLTAFSRSPWLVGRAVAAPSPRPPPRPQPSVLAPNDKSWRRIVHRSDVHTQFDNVSLSNTFYSCYIITVTSLLLYRVLVSRRPTQHRVGAEKVFLLVGIRKGIRPTKLHTKPSIRRIKETTG